MPMSPSKGYIIRHHQNHEENIVLRFPSCQNKRYYTDVTGHYIFKVLQLKVPKT